MEIRVTLAGPNDWTATVVDRPEIQASGATAEEAVARATQMANAAPPISLAYQTPPPLIPFAKKHVPWFDGQMVLYRFICSFILVFAVLIVLIGMAMWPRIR